MNSSAVSAAALALALAAIVSPPAQAVDAGEIDTFSGSLEGWFAGGGPVGQVPPTPPQLVADGGPLGAGDSFLQLTGTGSQGAGGRLVGMNASQWAGDYLAAGINGIAMDVRNLGNVDLTVRLYFEDPIPGPPQNEAVSEGFLVPAGGWTHLLFDISPQALTVLQGDASVLLANTTVLRIFHSPVADFPGEPVAGVLGIDNIQAVPEPSTIALMLLGLAVIGKFCRKRAT